MENFLFFILLKKNRSAFLVDPRAKSNEQRAKSNKQRAKSKKQRAKTNEQRATSNEQNVSLRLYQCFVANLRKIPVSLTHTHYVMHSTRPRCLLFFELKYHT